MRRGVLLATAASLLFVSGCCGRVRGHSYLVEADPAFSASEIESIHEAAQSWVDAVDGLELSCVTAPCDGISEAVICIHAASADEATSRSGTPIAAGHTDWNDVGGETWMRMPTSDSFRQEVAHEMGHAMGLEHLAAGTLMYYAVDGESPTPTTADVEQWWEVRTL